MIETSSYLLEVTFGIYTCLHEYLIHPTHPGSVTPPIYYASRIATHMHFSPSLCPMLPSVQVSGNNYACMLKLATSAYH